MPDAPFEAPSIESIGQLLPAFQFELLIAQGGMGAVYKARQVSLDRNVAIKVLPREMSSDPNFRASFVAEAKAMAKLIHPNLIGIFDTGDVDGLLYIVMELVPGKSLFHSCYGKVIDPVQAAEIVIGICSGLAHAHENGIIHRDIKPANILLTQKAEPKIGDFGLAGAPATDNQGFVMGTPGYTAPEILSHPDRTEKTSDIFSVGVVLQELLTGAPPETDLPSTPITDPVLSRICTRATHPTPAARYQDASEMEEALRKWKRSQASHAAPAAVKVATPVAAQAAPYPARAPQTTSVSSTNWPLMRNLLIIGFLLGAIYLAWGVLQKKKEIIAEQKEEPAPGIVEERGKDPTEKKEVGVAKLETKAPKEGTEALDHEAALASLERLQPKLRSGKRDEMPEGTLRRDGQLFLYIDAPKTWNGAAEFAKRHGGHLAMVRGPMDVRWFTNRFKECRSRSTKPAEFWFGSRMFGPRWQAVDGSPWYFEPMPSGAGAFGAIHENGILLVREGREKRPFFIQWHEDGTNPADLEVMLAKCAESLDSKQPVFPFSSVESEDHWRLILWRPTTFIDASRLAELGGGRLMEAETPEDADWIEKRLGRNGAKSGFWLGGTRENENWVWESGASWTFARWGEGFPNGSGDRLAFAPGIGWKNADPEEQLAGLIIEWTIKSDVSGSPHGDDDLEPGPTGDGTEPAVYVELAEKATELINKLNTERDTALKKNANDYAFRIGNWVKRGKNDEDAAARAYPAELLKADEKTNRIPEGIPEKLEEAFPEDLVETARFFLDKQRKIDSDFDDKAVNIHRFFIKKLEAAVEEADGDTSRSL
ncbi:MAG: protein kinase, partial [Verrucomicrobiota bacterium]